MRTKTNFQAVKELMARYTPKTRGIVTDDEIALIWDILELGGRDALELDDIRDMAVAVYGQSAEQVEKASGMPAMMQMMDAMSAVTDVIDREKFRREQPGCQVAVHACPPAYAVAWHGNREFLRPAGKPEFSPDPAKARTWASPQDACTMAGYAARQYHDPMTVVRIETRHAVFPVLDMIAEQAAFQANNKTGGDADER